MTEAGVPVTVWATVKSSPEPSMVTSSPLRVVCVPASSSGARRPSMTWWVRIAVSWVLSASTACSASAGMASNAGLAGAITVTSWAVFSASTRLACMTACTSVDSTGLLLAAVATGSSVMPVKLPSPSAGTAVQPSPNGSAAAVSVPISVLVSGAAGEELLEPVPVAASEAVSSEPQALSVMAVPAAVTRTAVRVRVRFTEISLVVVRGSWPATGRRGPRLRPAAEASCGVGSGRVDPDGVQSARPGGERLGALRGLHPALGAGRADGELVRAGGEVVGQHPLPPQVGVHLRGELRRQPRSVVDPDLDGADAAGLRPGHPGDRAAAGREAAQRRRGVDAGGHPDRRLGGPVALGPVGVERVVGGGLDAGQPLAGRHVAVEARDDHPHREAVLHRERLTVHPERDHRVLDLQRRARGRADGHPVDRRSEERRVGKECRSRWSPYH